MTVLGLVLLSAVVIVLAMLAMGVGSIVSNRCLRGSCGGPDVLGPDGRSLTCDGCPHRQGPASSRPSSDAWRR